MATRPLIIRIALGPMAGVVPMKLMTQGCLKSAWRMPYAKEEAALRQVVSWTFRTVNSP